MLRSAGAAGGEGFEVAGAAGCEGFQVAGAAGGEGFAVAGAAGGEGFEVTGAAGHPWRGEVGGRRPPTSWGILLTGPTPLGQ